MRGTMLLKESICKHTPNERILIRPKLWREHRGRTNRGTSAAEDAPITAPITDHVQCILNTRAQSPATSRVTTSAEIQSHFVRSATLFSRFTKRYIASFHDEASTMVRIGVASTVEPVYVDLNTSDSSQEKVLTSKLIITVLVTGLLSLVSGATIFGNSLVIISVIREKSLKTVTNFLITSLAIADLWMGGVVMPFAISLFLHDGYWPYGAVWCDLWRAFDVLCSTASILNLCMISLDRYWAIQDPMAYPRKTTRVRCAAMIVVVWLCSAIISFPAILWWHADEKANYGHIAVKPATCEFTESPTYLLVSSLISFYIPLSLMVAVYARIYRTAVSMMRSLTRGTKVVEMEKHSKHKLATARLGETPQVILRVHRGGVPYCSSTSDWNDSVLLPPSVTGGGSSPKNGTCESTSSHPLRQGGNTLSRKLHNFSREQKAAKTLGIVMGVFIICWLPFFLINLGMVFNKNLLGHHRHTVGLVVTWLGYFNSSINPAIYALSMKDFAHSFIKLVCPCMLKRYLDNKRIDRATLLRNLVASGGAGVTFRKAHYTSTSALHRTEEDDSPEEIKLKDKVISEGTRSPGVLNTVACKKRPPSRHSSFSSQQLPLQTSSPHPPPRDYMPSAQAVLICEEEDDE